MITSLNEIEISAVENDKKYVITITAFERFAAELPNLYMGSGEEVIKKIMEHFDVEDLSENTLEMLLDCNDEIEVRIFEI